MKVLLRVIVFLFFLEVFLRIGALVSVSVLDRQHSNVKDSRTYRIMCIGESTTFVGGKDSYPAQLERILNEQQKGKVFEVINRGIPGSDSADIVAALNKNLDFYKPDMVIAMVGINDTPKTVIYKDSLSDKIKVYVGAVRIVRVGKFLWAHVKAEAMRLLGVNSQFSVEDKLKREIKAHPKGSGAYIELGQYLIDQKAYPEAEKLFKKAVKVNPKKDWGYDQLAKVYLLEGRTKEAEDVFVQSLLKNAKKAWAYAALSRFYQDQHRANEATDVLKAGIQKTPDDIEIYVELGAAFCKQGQLAPAYDIFKQAMTINPAYAGVYKQMGLCYGEEKRYDDMESMFAKAVEADSRKIDEQKAYNAFLDLSDWYLKHHELTRAEALLKKVLAGHPDYARIMRGLANVYAQMGRTPDAEEYQRRAEALSQKPLATTMANYRKIIEIIQQHGISMIAMSYATRDMAPLEQMLSGIDGVTFVDNGPIFRDALATGPYDDYFTDTFAGDFGHCTSKGAYLLANHVAHSVVTHMDFKK